MALFLKKPRYYDAPDGEDLINKIIFLQKRAALAGWVIGIPDCLYHTNTKTALDTAKCLAFWIVPLVGLGTTFATVTFAATRIRKKDDCVNYAIGGLACSTILRAWTRSTKAWLLSSIFLVAFTTNFKIKEELGVKLAPPLMHMPGHYFYDFSREKDVDKDWRPLNRKMY